MLSVSAGMHSRLPPQEPASNQSKIEKIVVAIEEIRKQLHEVYKQWENCGSPEERMALRHRIEELEELLETMRREIVMLTQLENRRKQQHAQQFQATAVTSVTKAAPVTISDTENPGIYYPPDAAPHN